MSLESVELLNSIAIGFLQISIQVNGYSEKYYFAAGLFGRRVGLENYNAATFLLQ